MGRNDQLVDLGQAEAFIEANWPNDPLLRQIAMNLLRKLPRVEGVPFYIPSTNCADSSPVQKMEVRLIDGSKAQAVLQNMAELLLEAGNPAMAGVMGYAAEVIRKQKTAEMARGEWIGEADGYADGHLVYDVWYCSECNWFIDDGTDDPENLPRYCPNCGAKMDGDHGH